VGGSGSDLLLKWIPKASRGTGIGNGVPLPCQLEGLGHITVPPLRPKFMPMAA